MLNNKKSALKDRFKDLFNHMFINISAMDFNLYLANDIKLAAISNGSSSRCNTPIGSFWDNHEDCFNTDTSLSSLSNNILNIKPQTGEDCHSLWTTLFEATTINLYNNSKLWNFNIIVNIISSPIKF